MTARDIIEKAYRKTGEIGSGDTATNDEIQDGLDELNMVLDQMNQDNLGSYTEMRVDVKVEGGASTLTIADNNGILVDNVKSDGFTTTITTADYTELTELEKIRPYGYDYLLGDKTIFETNGKELVTAPENISAPNFDLQMVIFTSSNRDFSIITTEDTTYAIGDEIMVTDGDTFVGHGTIDTMPSPNSITCVNCTAYWDDTSSKQYNEVGAVCLYADRAATPPETGGYIHLTTAPVADIISPRPHKISRILVDGGTREMKKWENEQWVDNTQGYTYYSDYPYGTLEFGGLTGDFTIQYRKLNTNVKMYEEINLPPGYEGALVYELARLLGVEFGVDITAVAFEAQNRMAALRRLNHKTSLLKSGAPRSQRRGNFETGGR